MIVLHCIPFLCTLYSTPYAECTRKWTLWMSEVFTIATSDCHAHVTAMRHSRGKTNRPWYFELVRKLKVLIDMKCTESLCVRHCHSVLKSNSILYSRTIGIVNALLPTLPYYHGDLDFCEPRPNKQTQHQKGTVWGCEVWTSQVRLCATASELTHLKRGWTSIISWN